MFKITPIQGKSLQEQCAIACGANFIPDSFGYMMSDVETGDLMGFSQFTINSDSGYIHDLKSKIGYSDFEAMFILGRATLNFIDLCGTHTCKASIKAADERLMKCIGFKLSEDGEYFVDMTGMFDGKCDGHNVDIDKQ